MGELRIAVIADHSQDRRMRIRTAGLVLALTAAAITAAAWIHFERARVIEGTWIFAYEGSDLFEQKLQGRTCEFRDSDGGWLEYHPRASFPDFDTTEPLPGQGTLRSDRGGEWVMAVFAVRFEGRQRFRPLGAGHMGLSKSEYEVDRMLSIEPIPGLTCVLGWS